MKTILIILIVLFAVVIGGLFYMGQKSREGSAPGLSDGRLTACPSSPNCVSSESGTPPGQSVEPLTTSAWSRIPATIEAMGGTITRREGDYLAAEFRSKWFGFTDDVEFRRGDDAVHLRSASRVGHSDLALREQLGNG